MNTRSILIGAYELKKPYQRNLALGFGISAIVQIAIVVSILALAQFNPAPLTPVPNDKPWPTTAIQPPVLIDLPTPDQINTGSRVTAPDIGIPTPVPDIEAPLETDIPTQLELIAYAPDTPIEGLGENISLNYENVINEILPSMDTVIFYDEQPIQVSAVQPEYPEFARRVGIEGIVWLKVLIDKEGKTRNAVILKSSESDAGFEESAIDAALQSVWRPAISNGMPIAVWVSYAVKFQLK